MDLDCPREKYDRCGDHRARGPRSYVLNSDIPAGSVIPPGTVWVDGKEQGAVGW